MSPGRTVIDSRQIVIMSVQLDEIEKYGETSLYVSRTHFKDIDNRSCDLFWWRLSTCTGTMDTYMGLL